MVINERRCERGVGYVTKSKTIKTYLLGDKNVSLYVQPVGYVVNLSVSTGHSVRCLMLFATF